jgi:hypothetical protein
MSSLAFSTTALDCISGNGKNKSVKGVTTYRIACSNRRDGLDPDLNKSQTESPHPNTTHPRDTHFPWIEQTRDAHAHTHTHNNTQSLRFWLGFAPTSTWFKWVPKALQQPQPQIAVAILNILDINIYQELISIASFAFIQLLLLSFAFALAALL